MSLNEKIKPTKQMAPQCFQTHNKESKLCVVSHLTEYLKRIKSYTDTDKLFLTCIKLTGQPVRTLYLGGVSPF